MLQVIDFKVDDADDILIQGDDFIAEESIVQCALNVAGRRICGRYDDNAFRDTLCAGLERFLFSSNILRTTFDIKQAIIKALNRDNLFFSTDFDVKVGESEDPKEAKLYVIFKTEVFGSVSLFKIFVDIENQRVYRSSY